MMYVRSRPGVIPPSLYLSPSLSVTLPGCARRPARFLWREQWPAAVCFSLTLMNGGRSLLGVTPPFFIVTETHMSNLPTPSQTALHPGLPGRTTKKNDFLKQKCAKHQLPFSHDDKSLFEPRQPGCRYKASPAQTITLIADGFSSQVKK